MNLILDWLKTLFRWVCLMLMIPLLAVALLLTPMGLKVGFIILSRSIPGELHFQQVSGALLGPLSIKRLSYRYQDQQFSLSQLYLQWRPSSLLAGKFSIDKLEVNNLKINTPQAPAPTPEFSLNALKKGLQDIRPQLTAVRLPLSLEINQANFRHVVWQTHPGQPTLEAKNMQVHDLLINPDVLQIKVEGQLIKPYPIQTVLAINGAPQAYRFNLSAYNPQTHWVVNGQVNPDEVTLDTQKALIFGGELDTHLVWKWATPMSWQLALSGRHLDLSSLKPDLPHPLDITLNSTGNLGEDFPHFSWNAILKSPKTKIETQGEYQKQWNIFWNVQINELAELLPFSSGVINSAGELHGSFSKPHTKGSLHATLLRWQDYRADKIDAKWDVDISQTNSSYFQIAAEQLFSHWLELQKLQISGQGKWAKHELNISAQGYQTDLTLGLAGGIIDNHWQGAAQKLSIFNPTLGTWTLSQPTALYISPQRAEVTALCMQGTHKTQTCLRGKWNGSDNSWQAALTTRLNFDQLIGVIPEELVIDVPLDFHMTAEGVGQKITQAQLIGNSPGGNIRYSDKQTISTAVNSAKLIAKLDKNGAAVDFNIALADNNSLSTSLTLPKATFATLIAKNQELRGKISINLNNLTPILAIIPEVVNPQGKFKADLTVGGTIAEPAINGNASLEGGEVKIPGLNIQLNQINLALNAKKSDLNYILSATSSNKPLKAVGHTRLDETGFPTEITLTGENVLLADTPQYTVYVTPNMRFAFKGREINIGGSVDVTNAVLHQLDFQRETSLPEDEVVFIGEHVITNATPWRVTTQLTINLGDNVKVDSPGFKGKLQGKLNIISEPGSVVLGDGRIEIVNGVYEVFGRQLTIAPGSAIVYRKNPLSNPGLSVQATAHVIVTDPLSQQQLGTNELTIGMNINGTSSSPQITLFSSAGNLSQADMLSFLLLGTSSAGISPLNMNLMLQALNTLPLTKKGAGNVQGLTNQVKQGLGLTELGVESEPTLGPTGETIQTKATPTSYFVVGKRITSHIYFRYKYDPFLGVNLFQLIYLFTKNWSLQLETDGANRNGADVLYTIQTGTPTSVNKTPAAPATGK